LAHGDVRTGADLGVDFQEIAKSAADGIMDQHRRRAELDLHLSNHGVELRFVRYVAGIAFGIGDLRFERGEALAIAGKHRDVISARRESAGDRRAGPGPHSRDQGEWAVCATAGHHHRVWSLGAPLGGAQRNCRFRAQSHALVRLLAFRK